MADRQLTIDEFHSAVADSEQLTELFTLVPKVLEENALFADVGWELMSYWFKSKMDNVALLQESVEFIERIKNNRLRHGVAKLVWEKFLLDTVKALANIIERFARPPKEREAKQALQIQERHMVRDTLLRKRSSLFRKYSWISAVVCWKFCGMPSEICM